MKNSNTIRFINMAFSLLLCVFFAGLNMQCSSKVKIEGLDLELWKQDRNGCLGLRAKDLEAFREVKNEFLAKDNQALIKTFGRPDKVELADRSQTFFIYFIEPAPACEGTESVHTPLMVIFRLNAISRVSEVTISNLAP